MKRNYFYNTLYNVLNILLPLITAPYLSRVVGVENIGIYSYTFAIIQYFIIFAKLGLSNYGARQISYIKNDKILLSKTFSSIYYSQVIVSFIVTGTYVFYLSLINKYVLISSILSIQVFITFLDIDWLYIGLELFKKISIRNIIVKLISVIMVFMFVKNKNDLWIYALIMSISVCFSFLLMWINIHKLVHFTKVSFNDIKTHFIPNLKLTLPVIAVNIYRTIDKVMLGTLSNITQSGLYENAEKIIYCLCSFISSYGTVAMPRMSNLVSQRKYKEVEKQTEKSMSFMFFIVSPMCFGIMSISDFLMIIVFGIEFKDAAILITLLAVTMLFIAWNNVIRMHYIIPHKLDYIYIRSVTLGAIMDVIVNLLLISKIGALGATIGTLVAEFIAPLYQSLVLKRKLDLKKFLKDIIPYLSSSILMMLFLLFIKRKFQITLVNLLILIFLGGLSYLFLLIIFLFVFRKNQLKKYYDKFIGGKNEFRK